MLAAFVGALVVVERAMERSSPRWVISREKADALFPAIAATARDTVPGVVESVRFERSDVHVLLRGGCDFWVRPPRRWGERPTFSPARLVRRPAFEVEWVPCGDVRELTAFADALATSRATDAWVLRNDARVENGLLTPFIRWSGGAPWLVVSLAVAAATSLTMIGARRSGVRRHLPPKRFTAIGAMAVVGLGVALRVRAAAQLPLDNDESWALPTQYELLDATHDAWVHPPLFRVVQQGFVRATGVRADGPLLHLRAPSIAFSSATLILLALAIVRRRSAVGLVALAVFALSPAAIDADALARPYSLAVLGFVIATLATWTSDDRADVAVACLGFGVALWSDPIAGAAAGLVIASGLPSRSRADIAVCVALAVAWALPLLPGALDAARGDGVCAAIRVPMPEGAGHCLLRFNPNQHFPVGYAGTPWLAPVSALTAGVIAAARKKTRVAVGVVLVIALTSILDRRLPLRTRNVLFFGALTAIAWVAATGPSERRRR